MKSFLSPHPIPPDVVSPPAVSLALNSTHAFVNSPSLNSFKLFFWLYFSIFPGTLSLKIFCTFSLHRNSTSNQSYKDLRPQRWTLVTIFCYPGSSNCFKSSHMTKAYTISVNFRPQVSRLEISCLSTANSLSSKQGGTVKKKEEIKSLMTVSGPTKTHPL